MTAVSAQRRRVGGTAVEVTTLGFGAAAMGNLYRAVDEDTARSAVEAALDVGVRFFDTAPHYGFGLSESRLGAALHALDPRREVTISTKVGRVLEADLQADLSSERQGFVSPRPFKSVFDYSYDGVMRSYESSRERLRHDRIDVLLAHDLGPVTHGAEDMQRFREFLDGGYRAMRRLRDSGEVRAIGLGVNEWQICERALGFGDFDVFLLAGRYTLLEQTALDSFLPECARRGVSIIVGGPFNSGILASGTRGAQPLYYNYAPAPPEVIERVRKIEQICDAHGVTLAAAALQFPLMHPQVCSVIPGLADAGQVASALGWLNASIPESFWRALREAGLLHEAAPTHDISQVTAALHMRSPFILLHEQDNVLVCRSSVRKGTSFMIDGASFTAPVDIPVGHKVARRSLEAGAKVMKYGAPIGSMTAAVPAGAHVHLHNMRSDYIPSHTREGRSETH